MIEVYLEGEPVYRVRYRVFLENGQELMSSDDSPCNMSVGAGFSPVCVQAELVRPSAGERCSIPVTADIAAFVVRDTALIQTVALVDSPPRHRREIRCPGRIFCGYG